MAIGGKDWENGLARAFRAGIVILVASAGVVAAGGSASAAAKKLPDPCSLITKADVANAFATLQTALQPTSVSDPVGGKPANQGGQGLNLCGTAFYLPNSVAGTVLVNSNPITNQFPCPPKGQSGKTVRISGTKALIEPNPSEPKVVRDVTFPEGGGCVFIEISLSGGTARVPQSGFVDLAKAALAKKSGTKSSTSGSPPSSAKGASGITKTLPPPCSLLTKDEVQPIFGTTVLDAVQSTPGQPGVSQCSFSLTVGIQGKNVTVRTHTDYAHDPSYIFPPPSTKSVSGLPDPAYISVDLAQKVGAISVKLGRSVMEIQVNGYDQPVTKDQLIQFAKDALGRV